MPLYRAPAASVGSGLPLQLPIQDGRYYGPLCYFESDDVATVSDIADTMIALPFVAQQQKMWSKIGIYVNDTEGTAKSVRLGIYSSGSDGLPDALVIDAGLVDLQSSGEQEKDISELLDADTRYWLVALSEAGTSTATLVGFNNNGSTRILQWMFGAPDGGGGGVGVGVVKSQAFGALPSSFGAIDDYMFGSQYAPLIWLRTGV